MSDVFISYKREDQPRVLPMVEGLRHAGLSVAWDQDIGGGSPWRQTLTEHLDSVPCVIVVWSEASASPAGEFVHDEAGRAKARAVLLPVRIDAVAEPLGFGEIQSLDLVGWAGEVDDPRFQEVVAAARAMSLGGVRPARRTAGSGPSAAKNVRTRLSRLVPDYLTDLLAITSGPKQFLADRIERQGGGWQDGFLFFAVSFALTFAMSLPFARNPLLELPSDLVFVSAYGLLFGYAAFFAWRLVGATATVQEVLTIHFYLAGVLKLFQTANFVVCLGVLRAGDPALYQELMDALSSGKATEFLARTSTLFTERPVWRLAVLVVFGGLGAMFAWIVIAWGAYRRLTGLGKLRSVLAFLVFCALCVLVYALTTVIASALVR